MKTNLQCVSRRREERSFQKKLWQKSFKVHIINRLPFFSLKAANELSLKLPLNNIAWSASYHLSLQVTHLRTWQDTHSRFSAPHIAVEDLPFSPSDLSILHLSSGKGRQRFPFYSTNIILGGFFPVYWGVLASDSDFMPKLRVMRSSP